jgi:hypothetical protein
MNSTCFLSTRCRFIKHFSQNSHINKQLNISRRYIITKAGNPLELSDNPINLSVFPGLLTPIVIGYITGSAGAHIAELAELSEFQQFMNGIVFALTGGIATATANTLASEWNRRNQLSQRKIVLKLLITPQSEESVLITSRELVKLCNNDLTKIIINLCRLFDVDSNKVEVTAILENKIEIDVETQSKIPIPLESFIEPVTEIKISIR